MSSTDTDRHLVSRIRRRDAAAWEELIALFEGRLLAFVDSRLGNRATAEDVVQETFLGFLTSLPNYDETTPLETFLFSIAAYKLTDVLRREGRRPALPLVLNDAADPAGGAAEPTGKGRRASSLYRSREQRGAEERVVSDCLARLIKGWQAAGDFERLKCLELLFVLGWSNKDAAQRLGISEQSVANHKHFVVAKLKEAATAARLRDFDLSELGVT